LLLIASAAFWAIAANVIRVTLAVSLYVERGVDLGTGWPHSVFGVGLFVGELLMLLSTDRLLLFLLEPLPQPPDEARTADAATAPSQVVVGAETDAPTKESSGIRLWILNFIAVAFLVVGAIQAATLVHRRPIRSERLSVADTDSKGDRVPLTDVLFQGALPRELGPWERAHFRALTRSRNSDLGRYSIAWHYTGAKEDAGVSVNFPFVGWQHLAGCYQSRGWEIESRTVVARDASGSALDAPFVELSMRDATARCGYLLASQFTAAGDGLTPPATPGLSAWYVSARNRVRNRFVDLGPQPWTFQIQMLVTSDLPLSDEQRQQAQHAFEEATREILTQLCTKEETP
jgi:hypothetical protein